MLFLVHKNVVMFFVQGFYFSVYSGMFFFYSQLGQLSFYFVVCGSRVHVFINLCICFRVKLKVSS